MKGQNKLPKSGHFLPNLLYPGFISEWHSWNIQGRTLPLNCNILTKENRMYKIQNPKGEPILSLLFIILISYMMMEIFLYTWALSRINYVGIRSVDVNIHLSTSSFCTSNLLFRQILFTVFHLCCYFYQRQKKAFFKLWFITAINSPL